MNNINPNHYTRLNPEVIQVINDYRLGFNLGNVIKYLARAGHKRNEKEDVEKAIKYLEFELEYDNQEYYNRLKIPYNLLSKKEWRKLKYINEVISILRYVETYQSTLDNEPYSRVIRQMKEKIE